MSIHQITLPDDVYQRLASKAAAQGLKLEDFLEQLSQTSEQPDVVNPEVRDLSPEERLKRFREWINRPHPLVPHANEVDDSREAIYEDRW